MNEEEKSYPLERFIPILMLASIGLAFAVGVLWQKVNFLENGSTAKVAGAQVDSNNAAQPTSNEPQTGKMDKAQADKIPAFSSDEHIRGNKDAELKLISYTDLECPYCKNFHQTLVDVMKEYDGKITWVYRHFPLDPIHPKADKEAEAVECANELAGGNGFWKLADKIFEVTPSNNGLNLDDLPKLAGQVGISGDKLKSCVDSGKYADKVEKQYQGGVTAGVQGTPGSFLVNKKGEAWFIPGAYTMQMLKPIIEEALAS